MSVLFGVYLMPHLFAVLGFLREILLFKRLPRSTEMLNSIPKHKGTVMCLIEKIGVFNKLHAGRTHNSSSCGFNVNESTIYIK